MDSYSKLTTYFQLYPELISKEVLSLSEDKVKRGLSEKHMQILSYASEDTSVDSVVDLCNFKNVSSLLKYASTAVSYLESTLAESYFFEKSCSERTGAKIRVLKRLTLLSAPKIFQSKKLAASLLKVSLEECRKYYLHELTPEVLKQIRSLRQTDEVDFKSNKIDEEFKLNQKILASQYNVIFSSYELHQKFSSITSGDKKEILQNLDIVIAEANSLGTHSPKLKFETLILERSKALLQNNILDATLINIEIVSLVEKNSNLFSDNYLAGYSYLLSDCLKSCSQWELAITYINRAKSIFLENSYNQVIAFNCELEIDFFSLQINKVHSKLDICLNHDWYERYSHFASIWKFIKAASLNAEGKFQESNDILNTLDFVTKDKDYYNSQVMLLLLINYYELGKQDLLEKQFTNLRRYVDRSMKDPERKELFKHIHVLLRPLLDPDKDPESIITEKAEEFNAVEHYYKEVWNPSVPDYFHIHQWFKLRGEKEHKFFIEYHDGSKYEAEIKAALEKFSLKF